MHCCIRFISCVACLFACTYSCLLMHIVYVIALLTSPPAESFNFGLKVRSFELSDVTYGRILDLKTAWMSH